MADGDDVITGGDGAVGEGVATCSGDTCGGGGVVWASASEDDYCGSAESMDGCLGGAGAEDAAAGEWSVSNSSGVGE